MKFELPLEVAQCLVKLFLAGDVLGDVELAADFSGRLKQGHGVAALGGCDRAAQARRPGTHHGNPLGPKGRLNDDLRLMAGPWIHQA